MAQFDAKSLQKKEKLLVVIKRARKKKRNPKKRRNQKKRKRKNRPNQQKKNLNLSNKKTHLKDILRAISIWMILNDSTLTTTRINQFHTSGKNLTRKIIPSGDAITNMPMS